MANYIPPKQGKIGQIFDVVVLLVLTIGALYIPLWMGLAGSTLSSDVPENPTWESLGQNPTMVEKWNQLGYADPASAAEMISARFDYSVSIIELAIMILVIVGYYTIMLRFSEREYREVISEKFDNK